MDKRILPRHARPAPGSALLVALVLLALLTIAGVAGVYYSRLNSSGSRSDRLSRLAYNMAEKGILKAQKKIYLKFRYHLTDNSITPAVEFMSAAERELDGAGHPVETFHDDSLPKNRYFQFLQASDNRDAAGNPLENYRIRYRIDGGRGGTTAAGGDWNCQENPQLHLFYCQVDYTIEAALLDERGQQEAYLKSVYSVRRMNTAQLGAFFRDDLELGDGPGYNALAATFKFKGMVHSNGHFFAGGHKDLFALAGYLSAAKRVTAFPYFDTYDPSNLHAEQGITVSNLDGSNSKILNYTNDSVWPLTDNGVPGLNFSPDDLNDPLRHDGQGYGDPSQADTWTVDRNWQQNSLARAVFDSRLRDSDTGVAAIDIPAGLDPFVPGNAFENNAQVMVTLGPVDPSTHDQPLRVEVRGGSPGVDFVCPGDGAGYCGLGGAIRTSGTNPSLTSQIFSKTRIWNEREGKEVDLLNIDMEKLTQLQDGLGDKYMVKGLDPAMSPIIYATRADAHWDCAVVCKTDPSRDARCSNTVTYPQCNPANAFQTAAADKAPNGFRFVKSEQLPRDMMFVSPQPIYLMGNVNLHQKATNRYDPEVSGYDAVNDQWRPLAVVADSITLLSPQWDDNHANNKMWWDPSTSSWKAPVTPNGVPVTSASATAPWEINATLVSGNTPSLPGAYNGGMENFPRLLEDFTVNGDPSNGRETMRISGNFFQLWRSRYGTGSWANPNTYFTAPNRDWRYESVYGIDGGSHLPPGFQKLLGTIQPPPVVGSFISQYIVAVSRSDSTINRQP